MKSIKGKDKEKNLKLKNLDSHRLFHGLIKPTQSLEHMRDELTSSNAFDCLLVW